jgi:protocatechuate 3,4-dioxygenase beta subunit
MLSLTSRYTALMVALVAAILLVQAAPTAAQGIITNGTVTLGVNPHGQLNVAGPPSPIVGTPLVGLRYNANGWEALSHRSPCEGWGVGIANVGISGWANQCFSGAGEGGPVNGLRFGTFSLTADTATSNVFVPNPFNPGHDLLQITHQWTPSFWPNLYQGNVTIRNVNGGFIGNVNSPVGDIRYRRVLDWDIEPTRAEDFVTIGGIDGGVHTPAYLLFSGDNGFEIPDPLRFESGAPVDVFAAIQQSFGVANPVPCGFTQNFTNCGRFLQPGTGDPIVVDHGAMFDFGFPALAPGAAHQFAIFYGAAATKEEAEMALYMVGAEVYSYGNCRPLEPGIGGYAGCDTSTGAPVTFIFAAAGVGGAPVFGDISGVVYRDVNGNGVFEAGTDTPLAGVTVMAVGTDLAGNAITRTATTADDGSYVFMAMPRGDYSISSAMATGTLVRTTASPLAATVGGTFPYVMNVNFGYVAAAAVSGRAYTDMNANGAFDAGTDTPLAGVTMTLSGPGGARTATTDGNGAYSFGSLVPGSYTVSAPATAGGEPLATPGSVTLALGAGASGVANFGYAAPAAVSGTAYTDVNANGAFNPGTDTPLAGVTITLNGPGGARTATTDASGAFSFGNLVAGTYTASAPATAGGQLLTTASPVTLTLGVGQLGTANFGYVAPATVSGTAYSDANGNGVFDAGTDAPLAGVTLTLSGPGGTRTTTTNAGGGYSFANLLPGTYTVSAPASFSGQPRVTPSPVTLTLGAGASGVASFGYVVTAVVSGTAYSDANGNSAFNPGVDAPMPGVTITLNGPGGTRTTTTDANGAYSFANLLPGSYTATAPATAAGQPLVTPSAVTLTLGPGQLGTANFGYVVTAAASGTAYTDANANGVFNPGTDTPLAGVTITLTGPGGTRTATTDANGAYSFANLLPGSYSAAAPATVGGQPLVTPSPVALTLGAGQMGGASFGYRKPAVDPPTTIGGTVYTDIKRNHRFNPGIDTPLAGVTVTLTGPGGTRTAVTGADGTYLFAHLEPGRYRVSAPRTVNGEPLVTDSPVTVNLLYGQQRIVNFGYKRPPLARIHGVVFTDVKDNGEFNPDKDTPLAGVRVTLSGPGGPRTVTTGADGRYAVGDLLPGRYTVSVPATFNGQPTVTRDPVTVTVHGGNHQVDFGYKQPAPPACKGNDPKCKGKGR